MKKNKKKDEYSQLLEILLPVIYRDTKIEKAIARYYIINKNLALDLFIYPRFYFIILSSQYSRRNLVKQIMRQYSKILGILEEIEREYNLDFTETKKRLELLRTIYTKNRGKEKDTLREYLSTVKVIIET